MALLEEYEFPVFFPLKIHSHTRYRQSSFLPPTTKDWNDLLDGTEDISVKNVTNNSQMQSTLPPFSPDPL